MPEVTIKYKTAKAFKALQDVAKAFDMIIEKPKETATNEHLPIRFSKKPDANALSDIWKDNPKTLEEIREKAWGDRR